MIRTYRKNKTLLKDFISRDLKSRYVGSSMGFFWSVIFPLINLFVFMFVFKLILETRWGDEQGALEVSLVMLAGIIVWTAFAESISRSTNCLVDNANLIQKVVFPSAILPAFITTSAILNMVIGLPIVLGAVVWFGFLSAPPGAIEVEHQYATGGIWEAHEVGEGEGQSTHWPRIIVSLERAWRTPTEFTLEYSGTATRGVDYIAEHDAVVLPAGSQKLYLPVIPLRDNVAEGTDGTETIEVRIVSTTAKTLTKGKDSIAFKINDNELSAEALALDLNPAMGTYVATEKRDHHPLSLGISLISLPLLLVLLAIFTAGLGSFFAAFNLFWRDTSHLIGVGLTVWMFSTPIFYPASLVIDAGYGFILYFNPMYWFIEIFRDVTLFGLWPDPKFLGMFTAAAFLMFWLGGRFFKKHESEFPDLL